MSAASPKVVHEEYYLTKVSLQRAFRDIHNEKDSRDLHDCQPLEFLNVVIFEDTCRSPPPEQALVLRPRKPPEASQLRKRDKPAQVGFVHPCESGQVATGAFTETFIELAKEPQNLHVLIERIRDQLAKKTGHGRQERVCYDGSLVLRHLHLHPASSGAASSTNTIVSSPSPA